MKAKKNRIVRNIILVSLLLLACLLTSCDDKEAAARYQLQMVRNEQIGKITSKYFDAYARQPEAAEKLKTALTNLVQAINTTSSEGKVYALGSIGGADNPDRYNDLIIGGGIFDAIARQPEAADGMIAHEEDIIDRILSAKHSKAAEMIGFSSATFYDAVASRPEEIERFRTYANAINTAICNVKDEPSVLSIGYAATGFYDAVARQPESADAMWGEFQAYINTL